MLLSSIKIGLFLNASTQETLFTKREKQTVHYRRKKDRGETVIPCKSKDGQPFGKKDNSQWSAENMTTISGKYKTEFVLEFREACQKPGLKQSEVYRKAMEEVIAKSKEEQARKNIFSRLQKLENLYPGKKMPVFWSFKEKSSKIDGVTADRPPTRTHQETGGESPLNGLNLQQKRNKA